MASQKKPPANQGLAAIAAKVIYTRGEGGPIWMLPTNPDFADPNSIDTDRGVDPESRDASRGERAIAERVLSDLVPARLREWIAGRMQRHGGMQGLTRELLAMRAVPAGREPEKYRKALLRSLERSGPAQKVARKEKHETIKNPEYRVRIALLNLQDRPVSIGAYGLWNIENDRRGSHYTWAYTDPYVGEDLLNCRAVLAAGGIGMIDLVWSVFQALVTAAYPVTLEQLHALQIETREEESEAGAA